MKPFSCIAVDMGAGSIRIVLGVFDGKLTLKEVFRFENKIEMKDGAERWSLDVITKGILSGIEKAFAESPVPVKSIGVDSWGVDFVLLGDDGFPIEDPVSYRDKRTMGMKELWNTLMPEFETFRESGINYNVFNTLYQLLSLRSSDLIRKTDRMLFMADYINYFLSGTAVNEITLSATSQMVNCNAGEWDSEIVKLLGINERALMTPVLPGTKLGVLKHKLSDNNRPEVIAVAGHDTACAVAAIPAKTDNFAFLATGTWCIMGMVSDVPFVSVEAFNMGITNERTANGKFRPLKNLMGLWLIQQLRVAFGVKNSYAEIDEMASNRATSKMLIDTSDILFYNPDNMQQAFDEYLLKSYGKSFRSEAEYYRCAYDSLADTFRKSLEELEHLRGKNFDCIHLIGGGSQSKLLCQLTANATKKKVIAGPVEAAVTGNLLIQAVGVGYPNNEDAVREMVSDSVNVSIYFVK